MRLEKIPMKFWEWSDLYTGSRIWRWPGSMFTVA